MIVGVVVTSYGNDLNSFNGAIEAIVVKSGGGDYCKARMSGVIWANRPREKDTPPMVPVAWSIITPSPILKLPDWSVDVKITEPPLLSSTSCCWMKVPLRMGKAVRIFGPAPMYSKEWPEASTFDCLDRTNELPLAMGYNVESTSEIVVEQSGSRFVEETTL